MTFTPSPPNAKVFKNLGLLAELPGRWVGHGFNLIARPDRQNNNAFFLELNSTKETLDFSRIGGDIPNRGSLQGDINLHGMHYLQQVNDRATDSGIHVEPGLWIRVPPTTEPNVTTDTYVRQSTIPHGDSLLAQSNFTATEAGGPDIKAVDAMPFTGVIPALDAASATPVTNQDYLKSYLTNSLPPYLPKGLNAADTIKNPTLVLEADIQGQAISSTVTIRISTAPPLGNIINIPFVQTNANATQLDAIFWIETVVDPFFGEILQLQYVQRVILAFPPAPGAEVIQWPHISVATLRKQ